MLFQPTIDEQNLLHLLNNKLLLVIVLPVKTIVAQAVISFAFHLMDQQACNSVLHNCGLVLFKTSTSSVGF